MGTGWPFILKEGINSGNGDNLCLDATNMNSVFVKFKVGFASEFLTRESQNHASSVEPVTKIITIVPTIYKGTYAAFPAAGGWGGGALLA